MEKTNNMSSERIGRLVSEAKAHGERAFNSGLMCVPAHDPTFWIFFLATSPTVTADEALNLLEAWLHGWTKANLAAPVI